MKLIQLFLALMFAASQCLAGTVTLGTTPITIPAPQGYVEITPQMDTVWRMVQAAQGTTRILAFYIPEQEKAAALHDGSPSLDRNINIQVLRRFEAATVTPAMFEQIKSRVLQMVASRQMNDIQAKELDRLSDKIGQEFKVEAELQQPENTSLPPHINTADEFAYSELSLMQSTMPDGSIMRYPTAATVISVLLKGKMLNCYVTGRGEDLAWTRDTARKWATAIRAANQR